MTLANLIMLGLGLLAFAVGAGLVLRRGGSEAAVYVRRIAGAMLGALGVALIMFAIGLCGIRGSAMRDSASPHPPRRQSSKESA